MPRHCQVSQPRRRRPHPQSGTAILDLRRGISLAYIAVQPSNSNEITRMREVGNRSRGKNLAVCAPACPAVRSMACAWTPTSAGSSTVQHAPHPCPLPRHRPRCRAVPRVGLAAPRAESQEASGSALLQQLLAGQQDAAKDAANQFHEMRKDIGGLSEKMDSLGKEMSGVQTRLGVLFETQTHVGIGKQFGEVYSQQLIALSVQDFVSMLPDSTGLQSSTDYKQPLETARTITARLAKERTPARLLKSIHHRLEVGEVASEVQVSNFKLLPYPPPPVRLSRPTSVCCFAAR